MAGWRQYGPRGFEARSVSFQSIAACLGVDMAGGTRDDDKAGAPAPPRDEAALDEAALAARHQGLNARLSKILDDRKVGSDRAAAESGGATSRASAMAVGLRLSSELVAGVVVGAVIGWGLDRVLSTSPWGLIVFLLLGFVAGIINVMRSAGVGRQQG